jgi:Fic family protein
VKAHPRAGHLVQQIQGYRAFNPAPLPPSPDITYDDDLVYALSSANIAIGRLDALTNSLPNADLFLAMYVRHEALLSSRIEGTECTLGDVVASELMLSNSANSEVREVVRYVSALNFGLARLEALPLSNRLVREMHAVLLQGGRGSEKSPGEFRRTQNWIGARGCLLDDAVFVPPPIHVMSSALHNLENYMNESQHPALVVAGLSHAQFETIHPFLDGNGRTGRLLIALILYQRAVLNKPVLYLSTYLKANREEYFTRLTAIRERGQWELWLKFFLRGIEESAVHSAATATTVHQLRESDRRLVLERGGQKNELKLLDLLYSQPIINVSWAERNLGVAKATAHQLVSRLESHGILRETTGFKRNRVFRYDRYMRVFESISAEAGTAQ